MSDRKMSSEQVDLNKRRLFTFFKEQDNHVINEHRSVARPPYAVEESLFKRLCTGCGNCQTSCPNEIINITNGLAEIDVSYTPCDVCGECQNVCPTLALSEQTKSTGLIARVSSTCDNKSSYCSNCENSCSNGALVWLEGKTPVIDKENCIGCGSCISSCYISAISMVLV